MRLAQLRRPAAPAPVLVLGGVVGLEGGAVVAATIIPAAGIAGTVMLRLGFGSAGLIAIGRPSLRGLNRRAVLLVLAVGSLLAAHHLCLPASGRFEIIGTRDGHASHAEQEFLHGHASGRADG